MRRRRLALLAAVVFVLAGCAPAVDTSWQPPGWPATEVGVLDSEPPTVASAAVPGLVAQRIRHDGLGLQARFTYLPGRGALVDPFNDAVDSFVRAAIDARAGASGIAYSPQVHPAGAGLADRACVEGSTVRPAGEVLADPALGPAGGAGAAVVCDVVVAAGALFAERLRIVTGSADGVVADTSAVFYTDTRTGEVVQAAGLWTDAAAAALAEHVVEATRRDAGALSLAPAVSPGGEEAAAMQAALASTVPAEGGGFAITLPAGFTGPALAAAGIAPTAEPKTFRIDAALARSLASPFGETVLAEAGEPYAGPADQPAGWDRIDCRLIPCVGLTYDDGPSDLTPRILDALAASESSATFFVLGQKARQYGGTMKRAVREGHLVENHTWSHPHLPRLPGPQVATQLADTNAAISAATGVAPIAFRPPYGDWNQDILRIAGMPAILWDIDTLDWQGPADDELLRRVVDQPSPGSIVLQHDVHGNTARTAAAAYEGLRDRGFSVVNLVQLFRGEFPASGAWRSAR
ncbi:polysaccharide deacetylase family protein [Microbacterium sp. BK668]|uniref:polysaccharide deacetylase family protein n=1 Tax=Microbacterium sp. BK668 TaxID=2512118 RepID=UPI00105EED24|nr:polysaccharide deacetylase family protein [Microbacterium sp. BK668]TDN87535.1 peptidoglycan/xylan/chitin deacetylase (PgdA/CDA1 family) [Microbacterium sp. BK668]